MHKSCVHSYSSTDIFQVTHNFLHWTHTTYTHTHITQMNIICAHTHEHVHKLGMHTLTHICNDRLHARGLGSVSMRIVLTENTICAYSF